METKDKLVLITGAASGIGRSLALRMAGDGAKLILVDLDEVGVERLALEIEMSGLERPLVSRLDVANAVEVDKVVGSFVARGLVPDVLINNAGIGYSGRLDATGIDTWTRLIGVNLMGPVHMTHSVLPHMFARGSGRIVNLSSGQAFFRLPGWGAYAAVKLALGAWSELLDAELWGSGVGVTTVYPFMVNTGFYKNIEGQTTLSRAAMRLLPWYSMTPEAVAGRIIDAIRSDRAVEMVSPLNYLGKAARAVAPISRGFSIASSRLLNSGLSRVGSHVR